jgi:hypothetical protein
MRSRGWVRGKHVRYIKGHSGGKKKRTIGEKKLSEAGYVLVWQPDHPRNHMGWVFEHVLVMEAKLGRPLPPEERVHHKDRDRQNNDPDNLTLLPSEAEHRRLHAVEDKVWDRARPDLTGCIDCGRSDIPHFTGGRCRSCYNAWRRPRRTTAT